MSNKIISTGTVLDRILAHKQQEVAGAKEHTPPTVVRAQAEQAPPPLDFLAALTETRHVALIAELKRASPSKGLLMDPFDPPVMARAYVEGGAAALSVLTDEQFFGGAFEYLTAARAESGLPTLCKEFILDPYQVYQARAAGADAILLIVAALADESLARLLDAAHQLGMTALIEVHNEDEMARAVALGARLIGINNRDLKTFDVDLATTERLARLAPPGATLVGESGIFSANDVARLARARVSAILVGEALVTSSDVVAKAKELSSVTRSALDDTR